MYNLNVTNNYAFDVKINQVVASKGGGTISLTNQGNVIFEIPGMGTFSALDLGDKSIPGYHFPPSETWGVLFRYKTTEIYARYEGGGEYDVTIDKYGSVHVTPKSGSAVEVSIKELILNKKTEKN
jgi:hypothetical protein